MSTLQNLFGRKCLIPKVKNKKAFFSALAVALVVLLVVSILLGSTTMSIEKALSGLFADAKETADFRILFYIRLPRVLAAVFAGGALAVSGVLIQAVLQNPMAAPNVIGVNSAAGFAAALTIGLFPKALAWLPLASFVGALCACLLIYAIAVKTSASKLTITLVGIAVGSVLNAGTNTIKVLFPDSVYDADLFMIGGFSGVTFERIVPAAIVIFGGIVVSICVARDVDILGLGEMTARSLGLSVSVLRFVLLMIASALAGAAVSFAGLLGFVGLLVPHIMRRFVGNKHRLLIPASALAGSILVLLCDLFSRVAFAPFEIPVGIVLSFVGGIFFICLVLFSKKGKVM